MDWDRFIKDTKQLSNKIIKSNFKPDIIIAVARGGWIPTRLLSDFLKVKDIASIGIKYIDKERTQLDVYSKPKLSENVKSILIVEDMLESGKSIDWVRAFYINLGYEVKLASVYITEKTKIDIDYYSQKVDLKTKFPWEEL